MSTMASVQSSTTRVAWTRNPTEIKQEIKQEMTSSKFNQGSLTLHRTINL